MQSLIWYSNCFQYSVFPVCLPWRRPSSSSDFFVAGWGKITQVAFDPTEYINYGVFEKRLRFARLEVCDWADCQKYHQRETEAQFMDTRLCAGGVEGEGRGPILFTRRYTVCTMHNNTGIVG